MEKSDQENSHADAPAPSFEESLDELQQIVDELEEGRTGLEESMHRFERGIALLRNCYQILENAEQKIEILTGIDAEGRPQTAPFDASATADRSQPAAEGGLKPAVPAAGKRKSRKKAAPQETAEEDDDADTLF